MKLLVTGVKGQLGYDVIKCLQERNIPYIEADIQQFDITDKEAVRRFIMKAAPDGVIHCSAYTAVDKAEEEESLCYQVNVDGTRNIAQVCRELDAKMIYISTDYVFPGAGEAFYETEDKTGPLNVYGKTKLLGEEAVRQSIEKYFIVRVSWVFGINGTNFVKTMLRLGQTNQQVKVVNDQMGAPTYTVDLAPLLCDMIATEKYGTYHASNEGICSFAEFAREIFKQAAMDVKVKEIPSCQFPSRAVRPLNSRLSKKSLDENGFCRLPDWRNALTRYLMELNEN